MGAMLGTGVGESVGSIVGSFVGSFVGSAVLIDSPHRSAGGKLDSSQTVSRSQS